MSIIQRCFNFMFPSFCILCNSTANHPYNLCSLCLAILPWLEDCCAYCAYPLSKEDNDSIRVCGQCLQHPPLFKKTMCLFLYKKPASMLVTQLKFRHRLMIANSLGRLLKIKLQSFYQAKLPDLLIPVPLHPKRLRQRGFNQSLEIAKPLSRLLKIPIDKKNLQRIRSTRAQSEIPAKERYSNVKNAFQCNTSLENKSILLIDDVITTGHTIHECSKALKNAGAKRIDVCAIARTQL